MAYKFSDRLANLEGNAIREIFKLLGQEGMISFAGGFPDASILPYKDIANISSELLASDNAKVFLQYGASEGYMPFREQCVKHVKRYGIEGITEQNVTIVSGGQQTIDLTLKAFINKGDYVLVEDPTYLAVLHILKTYEANVIGVDSEVDGLVISDLETKIKKYNPKVLYLVPTFSNPTGRVISLEKRKAIIELTAKYGVILLEDDPYNELRYSGECVPSMKSMDTTGNVIYSASFSKTIVPGLRTGFCIASPELTRKIVLGKQATDVHTSLLSQAIITEYLKRGLFSDNVDRMIKHYSNKRDIMIAAIDKYMPSSFSYTKAQGGLFIWGKLDFDVDTTQVFGQVTSLGVAYVPGAPFYADGSVKNALRLNFSMPKIEDIDRGIKILGDFLKKVERGE